MYKESALITFYAETPVHMGAGQSVSYVDLPVQRERHTAFPIFWSSGIKGVIRDTCYRIWRDRDKVNLIFGPEEDSDFSSCISITDAKILLYPVRSVRGVFAWITCPFVLKRFKDELESAGINEVNKNFEVIDNLHLKDGEAVIPKESISVLEINDKQVAFEEFVFSIKNTSQNISEVVKFIKNLLPKTFLTTDIEKHFAIVSDDTFRDFVNYAVEVRTRVRIDQKTGTVKEGALFTEELIPSESVFYSLLFISDPYFGIDDEFYSCLLEVKEKTQGKLNWEEAKNKIEKKEWLEKVKNKEFYLKKAWEGNYFNSAEVLNNLHEILNGTILQLGGDETTGKGFMRVKISL